jgi:biotin carboxylase
VEKAIVLFGWKPVSIIEIKKLNLDLKIFVVEEPSLEPTCKILGVELISARYQQSNDAINVIESLAQRYLIIAVIPLREYSTPAAQSTAEGLGLPNIGSLAAKCFRNKLDLRKTVTSYNAVYFKQPEYREITNEKDAIDFFSSFSECIIKPSNRQSSVGVYRIEKVDDVKLRYEQCLDTDEPGRVPTDRKLHWQYQIEEFIEGQEYSTELFFKNRHVVFSNATLKRTHLGITPYEIGHILPMKVIDPILNSKLVNATKELAEICSVESGALHAEWMVRGGEIYLIECAGRPLGCFITDLISRAYDFNFFRLLVEILKLESGDISDILPSSDKQLVCGMRWFDPEPGVVKSISNEPRSAFNSSVNVTGYRVSTRAGERLNLTNNHTRVGFAIAEGNSRTVVENCLDMISINAITMC